MYGGFPIARFDYQRVSHEVRRRMIAIAYFPRFEGRALDGRGPSGCQRHPGCGGVSRGATANRRLHSALSEGMRKARKRQQGNGQVFATNLKVKGPSPKAPKMDDPGTYSSSYLKISPSNRFCFPLFVGSSRKNVHFLIETRKHRNWLGKS